MAEFVSPQLAPRRLHGCFRWPRTAHDGAACIRMPRDGSSGRIHGPSSLKMVPKSLVKLRPGTAGPSLPGQASDGLGLVGETRVSTGLMGQPPACVEKLRARWGKPNTKNQPYYSPRWLSPPPVYSCFPPSLASSTSRCLQLIVLATYCHHMAIDQLLPPSGHAPEATRTLAEFVSPQLAPRLLHACFRWPRTARGRAAYIRMPGMVQAGGAMIQVVSRWFRIAWSTLGLARPAQAYLGRLRMA